MDIISIVRRLPFYEMPFLRKFEKGEGGGGGEVRGNSQKLAGNLHKCWNT